MSKPVADILADFGLRAADLLDCGMEAKVFALGHTRLLKLYGPSTAAADLLQLQAFYHALDRTAVDFALPLIEHVVRHGDTTAVVERRIPGIPLQHHLDGLGRAQLSSVFPAYLAAVEQLSRLPVPVHAVACTLPHGRGRSNSHSRLAPVSGGRGGDAGGRDGPSLAARCN